MKKIVVSVGLVALSTAALYAVESSTLGGTQKTKAWSVQATLRGFYDDNIAATPNGTESAGVSIIPSVDYGFAGEQTSFNVGYALTARYFDKQDPNRSDKSDYTHTFDADFAHVFSPTLDFNASESFVIGQEPDLIRDSGSLQPIDGDNIRNFATAELNVDATQTLGFSFGYNNSLYNYDDTINSGIYDRIQHELRLDSRWKLQPDTVGVVGYTYSRVSYTGDQFILPGVYSDFRDSNGHRFYVGGDQVLTPTLSASVRVGAEFTDFVNDPTGESRWSPYATASLRYMVESKTTVDVGIQYSRTAASGANGTSTTFIRDMSTLALYGYIKHEFAPKLFATGSAAVRRSTYFAPGNALLDDESFLFYQLGLDLSYQFTPNFSAHVGYNYDQLDEDPQARDYERNRVYAGVTAGF